MRLLSALVMCFVGSTAGAWGSEFQRRSEAEMEERSRQWRERENASWLAESQAIGEKLAAMNGTSVRFNPDARTSPSGSGLFEDIVSGEWILGNGGVCVRTVWTERVVCKGGQGYSLKTQPTPQKRSKR